MSGPAFLVLYLELVALGIVMAAMLRRQVRGPFDLADEPTLTVYETAYLAGGPRRVMHLAMARLLDGEQLEWNDDKTRIVVRGRLEADAPPLERALYDGARLGASPEALLQAGLPALGALRERLVDKGLLLDAVAREQTGKRSLAVWGVLVAVGLGRLATGLWQGHPVAFLVAILVALLMTGPLWARRLARTGRGDRLVRQLRKRYAALPPGTTTSEGPLVAGLLGSTALAVAIPSMAASQAFMLPAYGKPAAAGGLGIDLGSNNGWSGGGGSGGDGGGGDSGGGGCGGGCGGGGCGG